jgi:hypothetical protein
MTIKTIYIGTEPLHTSTYRSAIRDVLEKYRRDGDGDFAVNRIAELSESVLIAWAEEGNERKVP